MASQAASAKQVVHQVPFRLNGFRDLFQTTDGRNGVFQRTFFLAAEKVPGLIDDPGSSGHEGMLNSLQFFPMAGAATFGSVFQGRRIRNQGLVSLGQGVGLVVSAVAVGAGKIVARPDPFNALVAGCASIFRAPGGGEREDDGDGAQKHCRSRRQDPFSDRKKATAPKSRRIP
jgi:hypothetical protein